MNPLGWPWLPNTSSNVAVAPKSRNVAGVPKYTLFHKRAKKLYEKQAQRQTDTNTDIDIDRQRDRQTDRKTDRRRQTDR